jgi:3-phenylpropionate/trans-cinnamate dioxygenase ferredoxin component
VTVDDLGASQVLVVEQTPHGALAVGMSAGKPFAVSNRCRHLFVSLGKGRVTDDGCLQYPRHAALYDVGTGAMVRGPQGVFTPLAGAVKATTGARPLKTFRVEVRDRRDLVGRLRRADLAIGAATVASAKGVRRVCPRLLN